MKQGTLITRVVMVLLFLTVCAYFVATAWRSLDERWQTVATYAYTVDDDAEATGLLVRQETVIQTQSAASIVDVLPEEGEKVAAGEIVANLYRDETALERKREIRSLELELEQMKYSLQQGTSNWDSARLDQSIVDAMVGLRTSAAYGDLTGLEEQVLTFKSLVIRRGYSTEGDTASLAATSAALDQQIVALKSAAALDTTPVGVVQSGTFSALVDGYEALVSPEMLQELTAAGLDSLMAQKPVPPAGAVGTLVANSRWYFAANLPTKVAERLVEGRSVRVRFSRDWSGEVSMTIERVGDEEDGRRLVVFSSDRNLADTSLLRKQTVDVIFNSVSGIRVPKRAVRDQSVTTTDPETGEAHLEQRTGVFVLTGAQAEFKQVEILADDGDYYLVQAVLSDNPSDNQIKTAFRAGDEVVISSEEVFDGKVLVE